MLWSTGETHSVALLTLALRAAGISATGLGAHEVGLSASVPGATGDVAYRLNRWPILAALGASEIVVVPGFLGTDFYLQEMYYWLRRIGYLPPPFLGVFR